MKVLLITDDFPPMVGGIARWFERICATVPPERVVVLAPHMPGDYSFDVKQPYKILRRRVPLSRHPLARLIQMTILCWYAIVIARRERVDTIQIGVLHLGLIALVLRVLNKTPYVLYLHGGDMARYMGFRVVRTLVRAIVRNARLVVVATMYTVSHCETLGIRIPRVKVLTIGVETDRFHPHLDGQKVRAKYRLDGQRVILTVARLVDYKGHDMVIRALQTVRQSVGPVRYLVVGSGQEEHRLRDLASALGCSEEVIFAGHASEGELPSFYAACDLFVMPSRPLPEGDFEGFGIVYLEAGACGKPVIGGRSGGVPFAVLDGVTGILVDPTDVGALSNAITHLLLNHEEAARLGMQGRLRAEEAESKLKTNLMRIWEDSEVAKESTPRGR